jgi:hypothetical protein
VVIHDGASFASVDWSQLWGLWGLAAAVPAYRGFRLVRAFFGA